ncbi:MAG: ArsR/SmtB family transcription factor [Gammaproteobacteria bacterium]
MVHYRSGQLDTVFAALADPTRRAVVEQLAARTAAAGELAEPFGMSLTGFMKHLAILERAGLVIRRKEGRVVQCALAPQAMKDALDWLERYRQFWDERLDALERYLDREEKRSWPQQPSTPNRHSRSSATSRQRRKKSIGRGPTRTR